MADIVVRKAGRKDVPFITANWLKSFRNAALVRGCPNSVYYYYHHKVLEVLLTRGVVLVACSAEDPDQLLGFVCAESFDNGLVIHFVYVKQLMRRTGIAKLLVNYLRDAEKPALVQYTAKTYAAIEMERRLMDEGMVYNPYLLWATLPDGWDSDDEETGRS